MAKTPKRTRVQTTTKARSAIAPSAAAPFASAQFWSDFSRKYWEKKPVLFSNVAGPSGAKISILAIDAAEVFRLLVAYCDLCRDRDSIEGIKFYVDGVRLESFEAIEHLPVANDKSLEGYDRRMRRQFKDYGLVCDELMQVSQKNWNLLGDFMNGLYSYVGIPNRFAELGLYLGNYRKTPFGVHVDRCGVISIPVVGHKVFRIWEPEFVEKHPELKEAFSYDEFKNDSEVLNASIGDITYWPSHAWHIAESDGAFSCTWSIGIWVDRPLSDVAINALSPLITKSLGSSGRKTSIKRDGSDERSGVQHQNDLPNQADPTQKNNSRKRNVQKTASSQNLPPELKSAAAAIAKLSKKEIETALLKWWREQSKLNGFKNRPR